MTALPVIRTGTPIIVRPGNRLQIGADPHRSVLVELHHDIDVRRVVNLLQSLRLPCPHADVVGRAASMGLAAPDLMAILDHLIADGTARDPEADNPVRLHVELLGRGPLGDLLESSLTDSALLIGRHNARLHDTTNLVVLTDLLVHDPLLVKTLTASRIPHLPVRVRDDVGLVGPLVLPGLSSCLRCADRLRSELDPEWPVLAAQLVGRSGRASTATIRATAAIAHDQIERLARALSRPRADPPPLLNHILHFRPDPVSVEFSSWPPHPTCDCAELHPGDRPATPSRPLSWGGERKL